MVLSNKQWLRIWFIGLLCSFYAIKSYSNIPSNDECSSAIDLDTIAVFTNMNNIGGTPSTETKPSKWGDIGKDIWCRFSVNNNSLRSFFIEAPAGATPNVALYKGSNCILTEVTNNLKVDTYDNNVVLRCDNLNSSEYYYIRLTLNSSSEGNMTLTISDKASMISFQNEQYYCSNAPYLCNSLEEIRPDEDPQPASFWYKFVATKNKELLFTITSNTTTQNIDWVLYDMTDLEGCANLNSSHLLPIRYSFVKNINPNVTGLSSSANDIFEGFRDDNFTSNDDGFVKSLVMTAGHEYLLYIYNEALGSAGYKISFNDLELEVMNATFTANLLNSIPCEDIIQYEFSVLDTTRSSNWDFGSNAEVITSEPSKGYWIVNYNTYALQKKVELSLENNYGCNSDKISQNIDIVPKLLDPILKTNASCNESRIVSLTANTERDIESYFWVGPNDFSATNQSPVLGPLIGVSGEGLYTLTIQRSGCFAEGSIYFLGMKEIPKADFTTTPALPVVLELKNGVISMINNSLFAQSYLWDFGDNITSTLENPSHTYSVVGNYSITLTVFNAACKNSFTINDLAVNTLDLLWRERLMLKKAYRPNDGDTRLAVLKIIDEDSTVQCSLIVIDLSGNQVFENNRYNNTWAFEDQRTKEKLKHGSYFYKVTCVFKDGVRRTLNSYFDILD